jgi:hypothetical protein
MERPLACWTGKDRYGDQVLSSLTIILKTGGCQHNRCRMCSYRHERYAGIATERLSALLKSQLDWVLATHEIQNIPLIKIYTSGSFFDTVEVPPEVIKTAAKIFRGKLIIAETRPEFVDSVMIEEFIATIDSGDWKIPLIVAIGLETTSDEIREKCIDKGFTWNEFLTAVGEARKGGAGVKAYLLHKPLFLTEKEAWEDMKNSIRITAGIADHVSLNPCTVQRNTELEYYWKKGAYRPPYLWSVLTLLLGAPIQVTCDPVGGGYARGAHNCGRCDKDILHAIRDYNLSADSRLLHNIYEEGCRCREEWEFILAEEQPYCMPLTR